MKTLSYTPKPTCEQLLHMFDVKKWMDGHIVNTMSGHVHQHKFKFEINDGKVLIFYKKWSTTKDWVHLKPKDILNKSFSIVHTTPDGVPEYVKPTIDSAYLAKISSDLIKFKSKFYDNTTNWWKTLLSNMQSSIYTPVPWSLEILKKCQQESAFGRVKRNRN